MAEQTHQHPRSGDSLPLPIAVGDLYEDRSCEPMLCVTSDLDEDELVGVSLVNGRAGSVLLGCATFARDVTAFGPSGERGSRSVMTTLEDLGPGDPASCSVGAPRDAMTVAGRRV